MSKPILCYVPLSPPARTAYIVAKEIGLDFEPRLINMFAAEHKSPEYRKINPLGKVPALIDGDFNVWDSHAIAIYLVEKYAKDDSLYPKDLHLRTRVNERLFFDASYLFQRLYDILTPLYLGKLKEIPQANITDSHSAYAVVEGFFSSGNSYVVGDSVTIADISIWATLMSYQRLVPIDEEKFPKITKWLKLMSSRSTYEFNKNGAEEHIKFINFCISGHPIIPLHPPK